MRVSPRRRLEVEAALRVGPGGGVTPGVYRVKLDGPTVHRRAAGRYEIHGPGGHHRRSTFCAYLNPHAGS